MSEQINLLRRRRTGQLEREKKILKILRVSSAVSLAVVIFFSLVLFILNINSPVFALQKQQSELISTLSPLQEKAAKILVAQSRLKEIAGIVDGSSKFDEKLDAISSSLSSDISIQSFSLGKNSASMSLKSSSLVAIDTALSDFVDLVDEGSVSKVTINQLEVNSQDGTYSVNINLDLL